MSAMVKRRQIQRNDVQTTYRITQEIPVSLSIVDVPKALDIAVEHNLYAYDAYFLQCSLSLSSPLMTLDARLQAAAKAMSIKILE